MVKGKAVNHSNIKEFIEDIVKSTGIPVLGLDDFKPVVILSPEDIEIIKQKL